MSCNTTVSLEGFGLKVEEMTAQELCAMESMGSPIKYMLPAT